MYKRNGVKYLQAKKARRVTSAHEARLELERVDFANRIHTLEQQGEGLIYFDETTFQIWPKPTRTWQHSSALIAAPENMKFYSAVTLYGAVGRPLKNGYFYMIANTTDITETKRFLVELAGALKNQYSRQKPYLIMDNHPAHKSPKVREELGRYHPIF